MKAAIMVPGADGGRWDVRDVQRSVVTAGHVLVRVHASSLNRAEFRRLHNLRIRPGQAAPEARTGGGDAAGEVVEIGPDVSGIKPGNRVMGRCADAGVDMVVDNIGADVLAPCLKALAVGGRFVTIGRMSGVTKGELDVDLLAEGACASMASATGCARPHSAPNRPGDFSPTCCRHWETAGSSRSSTALFRSIRSPPPEPISRPTSMSAKS